MRNIFLVHSFFIFIFTSFAQTGNIRGSVTDEKNKPLEFASILVMKSTDSSNVAGAITNEAGNFIIDNLPFNNYLIRISTIGYADQWFKASLSESNPMTQLGNIVLKEAGRNLKEIQVEAERKLLENNIDKKTFQVDKSIISQSGSAVDALQQLPNVTTDENGNLQIRGSEGVLILINGKPTGINGANLQTILNQIPANTIEKIEVITNPSSKYDAEGSNGIINIILKRNKKGGIAGNVNVQTGTRDKYNLSSGLSYNKGKFGISATYALRYNTFQWRGYLDRKLMPADTAYYFNTKNNGWNLGRSHAVSLSTDYYFNKYNTLSVTGSGTFGKDKRPEWIRYSEHDINNTASAKFARFNDISSQNRFYNVNTQYRKTFEKTAGKEFSISGNYTNSADTNTLNGKNQYTLWDYLPYDSISDTRQNRSKSYTNNLQLQSDFVLPLKKERKIETGLKVAYRSFDNEMRISKVQPVSEEWKLDSNLSNRFFYTEIINAGYFNFTGIYKDFGYQAGTRVEQTIADGELKYTGRKVGYQRLDFFPSFYVLKKIKKVHEWKVNYTRRIERPSAGQLNPFSDLSDPRNIRKGNPDLKPQFINNLELDYTYTTKKLMTNPGLYYKQTNNLIWRYLTIDEGINYVSFENIGTSYNLGLDWVTTYTPAKWFNTLTSVQVFRNRMKGQLGTFTFDNSNIMANVKQTVNFKIKKMVDLQFTYTYRSPFLSPQGQSFTMHWMDMGASMLVLKTKGTVTLTISDVFNTRQFGMDLTMPQVEQTFLRKMESRILYVGFNYRFGKIASSPKPKKKEQQEQRQDDVGF
ncbi:MAG: TonB-dependent receptor domain-containing protein [Bacteroidia bacterium]